MREITVTVQRFNSEKGSFWQTYTVPVAEEEVVSVMDLLEYIYENLDSSLAFFRHAACRQAACGKCGMRINKKMGLSCKVKAETDKVELAPRNADVVRDLVCRS